MLQRLWLFRFAEQKKNFYHHFTEEQFAGSRKCIRDLYVNRKRRTCTYKTVATEFRSPIVIPDLVRFLEKYSRHDHFTWIHNAGQQSVLATS